jgi:hypothetical protein
VQYYWWLCVRAACAVPTEPDKFWIGGVRQWPAMLLVIATSAVLPCVAAVLLALPLHARRGVAAAQATAIVSSALLGLLGVYALSRYWRMAPAAKPIGGASQPDQS